MKEASPASGHAGAWGSIRLLGAESEGVCQHTVDIALFHVAMEAFSTRAGRLQNDVVNCVNAAVAALRDIALNEDGAGNILVLFVGDVFLLFVLDSRNERAFELRTEGLV